MAAKPKPMSQIKQLLRLHSRGAGKKHIARTLQISRNTVKSYLCKLAEAGWSADELLELDDHELERRFHAGSPAYKDDRFADFAERADYFAKELRRVGVTRLLLWQEYRLARPDGYGYSQFCQLLAVHARDRRAGGYSTVREHLCSAHQQYLERSPQYYLNRAGTGTNLRDLFVCIFAQNRYPETLYKTCDGLLALRRKTEPDVFDRACAMALDHQAYTYRFVEKVLKNHMADHRHDPSDMATLPRHGNIRGSEYYQQTLNQH